MSTAKDNHAPSRAHLPIGDEFPEPHMEPNEWRDDLASAESITFSTLFALVMWLIVMALWAAWPQ